MSKETLLSIVNEVEGGIRVSVTNVQMTNINVLKVHVFKVLTEIDL